MLLNLRVSTVLFAFFQLTKGQFEDTEAEVAAPWLKRTYFGHSDEWLTAAQVLDKSSESQWYDFECDRIEPAGYHACGLMDLRRMMRIPLFGSRVHLITVESSQQLHTITDDWYSHAANLTTDAHLRHAPLVLDSERDDPVIVSMRWRVEPGITRQSIMLLDQQNRKLGCDDRGKLFVSRSETHLLDFSWFAIQSRSHPLSLKGGFILEHSVHGFVLSAHDDGHVYVLHRSLFDHTRGQHWSFQNIGHSTPEEHQTLIDKVEAIRKHM